MPCRTICVRKVAQRAPTHLYRACQNTFYCGMQFVHSAWPDARCNRGRTNAGKKKNFRRIDIAHPHHQPTRQKQLLDGHPAFLHANLKVSQRKRLRQWLHPQGAQQLDGNHVRFTWGVNDRTKPARVMQAQDSQAGHQVEMVVHTCTRKTLAEPKASRHSKVQQQQPRIHVNQQILAAPAQPGDLSPHERLRLTTQRPAQRLSYYNGLDPGAGNGHSKTAACDFHLWQLRHTKTHATG